ncbi:MAG: ABC transporter substrate-binding protein [Deltaproteobacteria bacterium]|nr:ABC transporter substrate-binding protein [Deltaproteobacteria bacterium]MBW1749021.1 ABC transporter substrate-binding protein [Deltaproteobacteria bacterium]MBW1826311.1 ABC transporter substrate-binding protein [Deltaproteobacteria bacterium]MBW1970039.1 ABC transporter substrate-binding protein [Deltaproteobacteria bacterium]MBW2155143.1 ABC transporter substrate-binding protein [Deltaproteobacteria bacterium]
MKYRSKLTGCLCFIFFAIGAFITPKSGMALEPVVVGVLHSEKFPYATMMKNSFEMALEVINEEGGIKGQPLKLVYANDQGKRKPGEKAVTDLVAKTGAVMLVGAYQSSNTIYMARIADKLDRPFLVCTAADDRITKRKWKNVYRLNPPAQGYTKGLEDFFLKKIKPKSMAIIYENSPYGTSGAMRMMWFCRRNDIDLRAIEPYHKERLRPDYFKRIVARVKEESPDVIYMVSYLNDAALLTKTIKESKINSLLCGGAGGFTHKKFINKAGESANNLLTATLWTQQLQYPGAKEYYNQYVKTYSIPPDYHGAEAYSSLLVAADVLKRAESFRSDSIRAAMDSTDMITPFGPVKFESYKNFERQNRLPTQVLQIIDGKFECVWPETLATTGFIAPVDWRRSD